MLVLNMFSSRIPVCEGKDLVEWLKPLRKGFGFGPQKNDHNTSRNLKSWNKTQIKLWNYKLITTLSA